MTKLLETLLSSEFTFGFEFEAYVNFDILEKYNTTADSGEDYEDDEYDYGEMYSDLAYQFSEFFGSGIRIVPDGSLGEGGFEFPTPPMNLTPRNIQRCIKFLETCLDDWGIYTDESCGFHVHFSFPQMNEKDMAWIICQIAMNDKYIHELTQFTTDYDSIQFLSSWARTDFLTNIKDCIDKGSGNLPNFKDLSSILSSDKYRLLRLHPQGTIEWRGPRNFLNNKDINLIWEFFYKVLKVSRIFADCMDKKYLGNYLNRTSFDKIIDFSNIERKEPELNKDNSTIEKIAKQALKNPLILTKIKDYSSFDYATLLATIEALYSTSLERSINDLYIELRYKNFASSRMLAELITHNPDFVNYVDNGLTAAIRRIFPYTTQNLYALFGKAKSIKPDVFREIAGIIHDIRPSQALNDFVVAFKQVDDSSCLHKKEILKLMADIYTFDKLDKRFARKGLILTKYLN